MSKNINFQAPQTFEIDFIDEATTIINEVNGISVYAEGAIVHRGSHALDFIQGANITLAVTKVGERTKISITGASAGSGAAVWGNITGTLSAQTDLQTSLNNKQVTGLSWLLANGGPLTGDNTISGAFKTSFTLNSLENTQNVMTSAWLSSFKTTGGAHTGLTAATEFISNDFVGASQQWLAGTVTTQRFNYFRAYTVTGASATATFTTAYGAYFERPVAGANSVITSGYAIGADASMNIAISSGTNNPGYYITRSGTIVGIRTAVSSGNLQIGSFGGGGGFATDFVDNSGAVTIARFQGNLSSSGGFSFGTSAISGFIYGLQPAMGTTWKPALRIDAGAHTALTATVEFPDIVFTGSAHTWLAGTIATQRFGWFKASSVVTGLATDAYTVYIDAPTGNITNAYALGVNGKTNFLGNVQLTQTVTTETIVSDTTVTIIVNNATYKFLVRA